MFITGPDVVKAVAARRSPRTGSAAPTSTRSLRRVSLSPDDDEEILIARVGISSPCSRRATSTPARGPPATTRPTGAPECCSTWSRSGEQALRHDRGHRRTRRRRRLPRGVHERWARNIICALARLDGRVVGIVANQPMSWRGCWTSGEREAARFVRCADSFNIPLVTLLDVPGFLPVWTRSYGGIIRHGAEAAVRLLQRHGAADLADPRRRRTEVRTSSWTRSPSAPTSLRLADERDRCDGRRGAANVIFRQPQIAGAEDRRGHVRLHSQGSTSPNSCTRTTRPSAGLVDDVIDPPRPERCSSSPWRVTDQTRGSAVPEDGSLSGPLPPAPPRTPASPRRS